MADLTHAPERPMLPALLNGWRRRCPRCGEGALMVKWLKTRERCDNCGQAFHHHRADDGPPYLTLLIVGHVVGPGMLWYFTAREPSPWEFMAVFGTLSVAMSLYFLPRLKGVLVAVQWANRMHGFGHERGEASDHPDPGDPDLDPVLTRERDPSSPDAGGGTDRAA